MVIKSNEMILGACARILKGCELAPEESVLLQQAETLSEEKCAEITALIAKGEDPLGEAYMSLNIQDQLRRNGETYTPDAVVDATVEKARLVKDPENIIDMGCGSGRFTSACAKAFPQAFIIAVDSSPFATLMTKAMAKVLGIEDRVKVICGDFTSIDFSRYRREGPALWIGNPPYVRHHGIVSEKKQWLVDEARAIGLQASALSGLHVYFYLAIAKHCLHDDFGVVITSAEWLDVGYGKLVRTLLTERLGLIELELFDRKNRLFSGVDTTSVIASFDVSASSRLSRSITLAYSKQDGGVRRELEVGALRDSKKWSLLFGNRRRSRAPRGYVRLGDFACVHRGIVTGANKFWVRSSGTEVWEKYSIPVVAHAREVSALLAGTMQPDDLSRLMVLPQDLRSLSEEEAIEISGVIQQAESLGIDQGYVARSRKCWWSIAAGEPAAIFMTYMSRKPPVFVSNPGGVRSLNVVHGIYPFVDLSEGAIKGLVDYLNASVSCEEGRTYSGGLTKFEPREAEEIMVPSPKMLEEGTWRS